MNFSQDICNYTSEGRLKIHRNLKGINQLILKHLLENPLPSESIEFNDNRISLFVGQNGKCAVSGDNLKLGEMEVHHKIPKELGGSDAYSNLIYIKEKIHNIIHTTQIDLLHKFLSVENLDKKAYKRVNELRILVGNFEI